MYSSSVIHNFPRHLTVEEVNEPLKVIENFFIQHNISESRDLLKQWLKVTLTGDFVEMGSLQRAEFLAFFDNIERVVEAVHIIKQREQFWKGLNKE